MSGDAEALREACAIGDVDGVASITRGANYDVINDCHVINGWTPLHWAVKRGHTSIINILLKSGADPSVFNAKGEKPEAMTTSPDILKLLGAEVTECAENVTNDSNGNQGDCLNGNDVTPFVPNYIRHPPFPYAKKDATVPQLSDHQELPSHVTKKPSDLAQGHNQSMDPHRNPHPPNASSRSEGAPTPPSLLPPHLHHPACQSYAPYPGYHPRIFVLKVRIADQLDPDFIEVEFPRLEADVTYGDITSGLATSGDSSTQTSSFLTFDSFVDILCDELRIPTRDLIMKIRKLPDTVLRKNRDIQRLKDFQEIEVVVSKKPFSSPLSADSSSSMTRPFLYEVSKQRNATAPTSIPLAPSATTEILY